MNIRLILGLTLCFLVSGCISDTLQETYEKTQKSNGMDSTNIIHLYENDRYGLVFATAWNAQYPENRNRPGISYYKKVSAKWKMQPGTDCGTGTGSSILGLSKEEFLYCGVITSERPFTKI